MNRLASTLAVLLPLTLGGVCGSVLRRYDPVDWPTGPSGAYERDFGTLHMTVWGLMQRSGRFEAVAANRGATAATIEAVEMHIDGRVERWGPAGGPIVIAPGAEAEVVAEFAPPEGRGDPRVVLITSVGPIAIDLELP
jgi:hypothetical protein